MQDGIFVGPQFDASVSLLEPLEVFLQRIEQPLGVARRGDDPRADFCSTVGGLNERKVEHKLVLGVIEQYEIGVHALRNVVVDLHLQLRCGRGWLFRHRSTVYYRRGMRALGLDVGSKTIGVAIVDEAGIAAHPVKTIARAGTTRDVVAIAALVAEMAVTDLVIGMPLELSGRVGHRARRVAQFAAALREGIPEPVRFHHQDERFSTAEAQRVLIAADLSRKNRKQVIDQQAATIILQTWLDATKRRHSL